MEIVETIRSFDGLRALGTVSLSDIEKAEAELSVSFSSDYKKYTSTFGAISVKGMELTGVVAPAYLNVVAVTKSARRISPSAKHDWYVLMDPHIDGIVIWQDKEGKVYQTAPNCVATEIASSLSEYLKSL